MLTLAQAADRYQVDVLDHLDRQVDIPVLTGPQAQGDVIVLPHAPAAKTGLPAGGLPVVEGGPGGHTHRLLADGPVLFDRTDRALDVGVLTVGEGAVAYLAHPEHGFAGVGPGSYVIRRQREQAEEERLVAD
ncbi:MAG: hypothetical protein LC798_10720 [Chloroflexi bacterium]|nr:hypothetical protein [Chloroflexota bacterium]